MTPEQLKRFQELRKLMDNDEADRPDRAEFEDLYELMAAI
jgi:hypothetical protein